MSVSVSVSVSVSELASSLSVSETVIVTAWALYVLAKTFHEKAGEWKMLAAKANKYIQKHGNGKTVEEIQKAMGFGVGVGVGVGF